MHLHTVYLLGSLDILLLPHWSLHMTSYDLEGMLACIHCPREQVQVVSGKGCSQQTLPVEYFCIPTHLHSIFWFSRS